MLHYAAPTTKQLIRVDTPALFEFFLPLGGRLKTVTVYSGQAVQGATAARVAVRTATGATLGEVTIASGASSASEATDTPVVAGQRVRVDVDESTAGGIGAPLTVVLAIDDGLTTGGGTTGGGGTTQPSNALTENGVVIEENGQMITEG